MKITLKNHNALITGGGHGLGREIALSLAEAGSNIIICGRSKIKLRDTTAELKKFGVNVFDYSLEATDADEVKHLFSGLIDKIGSLDILINNIGGVEKFGSFFDLNDEEWKKSYELNFMTMVYFCREAIPWLKKSGSGRIINISAVPARQPGVFNPHYSAAKAAMLNLSKHLANILAADNILVNAICPGTMSGGGWERNVADKARRMRISVAEAERLMKLEELDKVPLERIGTLQDVANLVAFLVSDKANFINGVCIDVDGGVVRSII